MKRLTFEEIRTLKGLGSSLRMVLKLFIDKGATIWLIHEQTEPNERYFIVDHEGLRIPLRSAKLNFYSTFNSLFAQTATVDKLKTFALLSAYDLPTPATEAYIDVDQAEQFMKAHGSIVVKPLDGAHGDGITTNVSSSDELQKAIQNAKTINEHVLLQQQVSGRDFRLLFIDYEFIAAVERVPASVLGDGQSTVQALLEARNEEMDKLWKNIRSGSVEDSEVNGSVSKTPIEEVLELHGQDFLSRVPGSGETVQVLDKANVSLGGQTRDVTEEVSPELTSSITQLLKEIDLPLCGVDVMSTDISAPVHKNISFIIELNAAPGLRLHQHPTYGPARPVCEAIVESLIKRYKVLQKT